MGAGGWSSTHLLYSSVSLSVIYDDPYTTRTMWRMKGVLVGTLWGEMCINEVGCALVEGSV